MVNKYRQKGEGFWGLVFLLAIIGVIVWVGLLLIPIYMENGNVVHSLESLKDNPEIKQQNPMGIKKMLTRSFGINDIGSYITEDNITVVQTSTGGFKVTVAYERSAPFLMKNLFFLVKFEDSIEI